MTKLKPRYVAILMTVIVIFIPGIVTLYSVSSSLGFAFIYPLWSISYDRILKLDARLVDLYALFYAVPLFFGLSFVYVIQVVRYYQGNAKHDSTILLGILSMIPGVVIRIGPGHFAPLVSYMEYITLPFPVLFIVGLVIMRIYRPPPPILPWESKD